MFKLKFYNPVRIETLTKEEAHAEWKYDHAHGYPHGFLQWLQEGTKNVST